MNWNKSVTTAAKNFKNGFIMWANDIFSGAMVKKIGVLSFMWKNLLCSVSLSYPGYDFIIRAYHAKFFYNNLNTKK